MANLSLGVGWNSGSWFAVAFGPGGFDHAAPFDEIGGLWHRYEERAARVLVGVPIGLVDDVLDTVALAYTARPGPGKLRSLPPDPPTDTEGLPTRIVYRASAPLTE